MRKLLILAAAIVVVTPSIAAAEFDNSVPWRNLSTAAPIVITQRSVWFNSDGTVRLCVSFRNVSDKTATAARITFSLDDLFGSPLRQAVVNRSGSFGPGILIEGKMDVLGGNSDSFNNCATVNGTNVKPSLERIDVTNVNFDDGTKWAKGDSFVRAFDASGNKVAPTSVAGGTSGASNAVVNIGGATAVGGTVGPSGPLFGTIAWLPGSRTAYGVVVDAPTQDDADFAAMTACTKANNGNPGCKPAVRMFGADKKCGAIATDLQKTATARGPDAGSTVQSVLTALAKEGGTVDGTSIVTSKCNSH